MPIAHQSQQPGVGPAPGSALYARLWRWHFFGALLVIPFVLWQAITGTAYLWNREIALAAHAQLLQVEPAAVRSSYESQLESALEGNAGAKLSRVVIRDDPRSTSAFYFTAANGLESPTFVDPYSGHVLGSVKPARWLPGISRSLHGGWPLGDWGSYLLELCAGWAIVMILTGLYLWWPRGASGFAGVLYPRLDSGPRRFWRDLHATVGVWFALIVLGFLFTALPWTSFWGGRLLGSVMQATAQNSPADKFFSGGGHAHDDAPHAGHAAKDRAPLDAFVAAARADDLAGPLEIRLGDQGPVQLRTQTGRAPRDIYLQLDRSTGSVLSREGWSQTDVLPRLVALGVDLHQGTYFGRANQWFNTGVATALVWLAITGFIGWYRRRPQGGLAAPPRRSIGLPRAVVATGVVMCMLMPLLGLSVLAIWLLDAAFGRNLDGAGAAGQ